TLGHAEVKAAAPATVRGEPCSNVPLSRGEKAESVKTREPGDRPASRLRACFGRGVPVQRGGTRGGLSICVGGGRPCALAALSGLARSWEWALPPRRKK